MNIHGLLRGTTLSFIAALHLVFCLGVVPVLLGNASASDLGLTEADCRCCHGETLADRHHLIVNTNGLECLSCHSMNYSETSQQYEPVVVRDCIQCHAGSLADRHHILVDQVTYTCFSCHAMVYDPATMEYTPDFSVSCQAPPPAVPRGQITGTVIDAAGAPLAWVRVASGDGSYAALTTEAGTYALADIPAGTRTLVATLDGFVAASLEVSIEDGQTTVADFVLSPLVPVELCGDELDNDGNGKSDCADPACAETDACLPGVVEVCGNALDDDHDGRIDCADSDCRGTAACRGRNGCPGNGSGGQGQGHDQLRSRGRTGCTDRL